MTKEQIMVEVQNIFCDVFDDDELLVGNGTNADDVEEWDSLMQIRLIVSIEKKFNIKFAYEEMSSLQNVGEMVSLIDSKIEG